MHLATKVRVEGKALKIIEAICPEADAQLNLQRFRRLCGMFRSQELVWSALEEHGKDAVIRDATKRDDNKAGA